MNYWHTGYLKVLSKILLFVFVIEPVLFTVLVRPVRAQSNMSARYDQAFSSYDGISQWGNASLTSSPAIGSALKSCLNVVPTFTRKIKRLFSSSSSGASAISSISAGQNSSSSSGNPFCVNLSPEEKFASGLDNTGAMMNLDGYLTNDDISRCQEIQNEALGAADAARALQGVESIDVRDQQAISELERLRKAEEVTQEKLTAISGKVGETNKKLDEDQVRDNCMDSIAYSMTKTLLAGVTEGTVNLINTGNFGDPFFIKDSTAYFQDIKKTSLKQVFGGLLDEVSAIGAQNYPYLKNTYLNLAAQNVPAPFRDRARFTLEQVLSGQPYDRANDPFLYNQPRASGQGSLLNLYKRDFSVGGWRAWIALTQQQQNNPIGFAILSREELEKKQTAAAEQAKSELEQSGGFLSMRKCVEQRVPKSETDSRGFKTFTGEYDVKTRGITVGPNDPDCVKSEVTTPGRVLASRLDAVITSDVHQLELADQFNESLNMIFTAAFNRLTSEGLSSLSSKVYGSWAAQATRQSFVERYNNAVNQGTNSSPSSIGTAELIYRRPQTSYNSSDFDITTDLFDQQIGCVIRPGVLTTEKRYLQELKKSNNKTVSPIYKLMPAMAELDYCIPGPTTNWESIADEKYRDLANLIRKDGITFIGSSEVPLSTYSEIGSQIGKLELKQQRQDSTMATINTSVSLATGLSALTIGILTAAGVTSATGVGIIIGAALAVVGLGVMLYDNMVNKRKSIANEELRKVLDRAPGIMQSAVDKIFHEEAFTWGNEQLDLLNKDYTQFKQAVYKKFSDANSIPVASVARPFVQDLSSYAENILTIQKGYDEEIKTQEQIVSQVEAIATQVQKIKDAAIARLPGGKLPELPKECRPLANQCPSTPVADGFLLQTSGPTRYASLPTSNYNPNMGSFVGLATPGSTPKVNFPKPAISYRFDFSSSNGTDYLITADITADPTTLSIKLRAPFFSGEREVYGLGMLDLAYTASLSSMLGQTITITGYNPNGESSVRSCVIKKSPSSSSGVLCDPILTQNTSGQQVDTNAGGSL